MDNNGRNGDQNITPSRQDGLRIEHASNRGDISKGGDGSLCERNKEDDGHSSESSDAQSELVGKGLMDGDTGIASDIMDDLLDMPDVRNMQQQDMVKFLRGEDGNDIRRDGVSIANGGSEAEHGNGNQNNGRMGTDSNDERNVVGNDDHKSDDGGDTSAAGRCLDLAKLQRRLLQ